MKRKELKMYSQLDSVPDLLSGTIIAPKNGFKSTKCVQVKDK